MSFDVSTRAKCIFCGGKMIYFIDLSGCRPDDALKVIEKARVDIRAMPEGSVLTLTDVTGSHFNDELRDSIKELANGNKPYVRAGAVVGIEGLKKIIFNAVVRVTGRQLSTFNSVEEAKNWLLSK